MKYWSKWLPYLLVVSIPLWFFGDYLFSDSLFKEISPLHFEYAEKKWFYDHLKDGVFAWLYPNNELGHSLGTNPASGLLFLPNLLYVVLPFNIAHKILFFGHYFILFFGLRKLLRYYVDELTSTWMSVFGISLGLISSLPIHTALGYVSVYPWALAYVIELWRTQTGYYRGAFFLGSLFLLGDPLLIPVSVILGSSLEFDRKKYKTVLLPFLKMMSVTIMICLPYLWMTYLEAGLNSRSLGIPREEALLYSTAPIRILDWLFPGHTLYEASSYFENGFQLQWRYPVIGGGVILTFLTLKGMVSTPRTQALVLGIFTFFIVNLCLGKYSPVASWLLENMPLLKIVRYPERFIVYLIPSILLLASLGLPKISSKFFYTLIILGIIENTHAPRRAQLIKTQNLTTQLPRQIWRGNEIHYTRYMLCEKGLENNQGLQYFDVSAYGMAMVDAPSNTRPAGLKAAICPWALSEAAQKWLGYTHVITPIDHLNYFKMESLGFKKIPSEGDFEIWETLNSSPWLGYFSGSSEVSSFITKSILGEREILGIDKIKNGVTLIDEGQNVQVATGPCSSKSVSLKPDLNQQSYKLNIPAGCHGLLNLPLEFHEHWVTIPAIQKLRVNSATLSLMIPENSKTIILSYSPVVLNYLAIFSFFIQFLAVFNFNLKLKMKIVR